MILQQGLHLTQFVIPLTVCLSVNASRFSPYFVQFICHVRHIFFYSYVMLNRALWESCIGLIPGTRYCPILVSLVGLEKLNSRSHSNSRDHCSEIPVLGLVCRTNITFLLLRIAMGWRGRRTAVRQTATRINDDL